MLTNAELAQRIDTSDEWIRQRTGIGQRHIAADGELTSDLATKAADAALTQAGISASAVDLIVLATATPDETFPATATVVQNNLGIHRGAAFDIQAVCSGFVYALATADNFLRCGQANTVLVIGAETFSRILDWNDRGTCVLFGDGAGAVVLRAGEGQGTSADRGILSTHLFSDGQYHDLLYVDGGPSTSRTSGLLRMAGKEVFRHAVVKLAAGRGRRPDRQQRQGHRRGLAGAAPGQPADHRCHGREAAPAGGARGRDHRAPCQYLGRLHPAGHGGSRRRRPDPEGSAGPVGGHGRRFHLGLRPDSLVTEVLRS